MAKYFANWKRPKYSLKEKRNQNYYYYVSLFMFLLIDINVLFKFVYFDSSKKVMPPPI
jgi:hypothetical protein